MRVIPDPPWYLCTGWFSVWCWIDELCHYFWPLTYGQHFIWGEPLVVPSRWICRRHDEAVNRYWSKRIVEH